VITIFLDGDACSVKQETYYVAARYALPVIVVANAPLRVPERGGVQLVHVLGGLDVADDWIAEAVGSNDIVATADLPLAARALARGAVALDFRGAEFTQDSNVDLLATREITRVLRPRSRIQVGQSPSPSATAVATHTCSMK
jgi:uncharacterized protein YaiI (UPF0178 family)